VHLDHSTDFTLSQRAIVAGFSSVMFDGSQLAYSENVAGTRETLRAAHACGVSVEAEIGAVGYADGTEYTPAYTTPALAARFEADAGPDCLAVAVGTVHRMTAQNAEINFALLDEIRAAIRTPVVIHGSTGVSDHDLQNLVRHGAKKINIGTQLRISFGNALRRAFEENPNEFDRLKLYPAGQQAVYAVAKEKMQLLDLT
ncbi:MAG: class II fructose-bisphosphate aldolase, partial [Oscillospiraceae bacterium]